MRRLEGKIALVTGAGSGIGRGCAVALAAEGARVIVTDVDEKGGRETCDEIGKSAQFHKLDVSDERAWTDIAARTRKDEGSLHVLVNNAGICIALPVAEMTYETWKRQLAINLDSMFLSSKYLIPLLTDSGGGSIVNLSSVAGLKGIPGLAGYCASKGGVRLYTKALALECAQARNKIRVNSIHPGAIETPIWVKMVNEGEMPDASARRNADIMEQTRTAAAAVTPLGFYGLPSDVAAGVVFLASDESRFITGIELVIDGGVYAG
jgi:NAD(P)-dependent dehydrogenase (short-subunit alcohol dehydrogenase family)